MPNRLQLALVFFAVLCLPLISESQTPSKQTSNSENSISVAERIRRVESGIPTTIPIAHNVGQLNVDLPKLMEVFHVPGLSVAVIDNYTVAWAKAYGVTEVGGATPVTIRTLFQAGSISKPVAATGALHLVEHGRLSFDDDVNQKLDTWKIPENQFTKVQRVTLRRLLSHSAGLTVEGFPGYATGEPIPTLVQILNGEKPANTQPIRVDFVPGSKFRYSGGGFTIVQQLIIDVTGTPFPKYIQETVLGPIGMADSTYEEPLSGTRADSAATATYANGRPVPGKWHVYPEMAAAGLWTTPTDLAKFAIEIALSKSGKSNRVFSQTMTNEMLKPQIERVGLGFFLGDEESPDEFGHDGGNEGFQADLVMFADSGHGVAIMGNSNSFFRLAPYVEESIAQEYGWKMPRRQHSVVGILMLLEAIKGAQAAIQQYQYFSQAGLADFKVTESALNDLGYQLLSENKVGDAITAFKLNVQDYPKCSDCYDSLGEAYMTAGQKERAIQSYEKSVELDPQNKHGWEMLKKLKGQN